jgi:hypothetical protein
MAADFTNEEIKLIREQYPLLGISIAPRLQRHSREAIQWKAKRLGVKRLCCVPDYTLRENDAIALAMLIDCEGTIGIWKRSKRECCYNPEIDIYNTNKDIIEWATSVIQTLPFRYYIDDRGHIIHKRSYQVSVRGIGNTYSLLSAVSPFLKAKKEQANLVIQFDSSKINRPIRQKYCDNDHMIYYKLLDLNRKGRFVVTTKRR